MTREHVSLSIPCLCLCSVCDAWPASLLCRVTAPVSNSGSNHAEQREPARAGGESGSTASALSCTRSCVPLPVPCASAPPAPLLLPASLQGGRQQISAKLLTFVRPVAERRARRGKRQGSEEMVPPRRKAWSASWLNLRRQRRPQCGRKSQCRMRTAVPFVTHAALSYV
jgi:hypothetical protein